MTVRLLDVYSTKDSYEILLSLLIGRSSTDNISHKEMPVLEKHVEFVESKPYECWYLIEANLALVGSIYLTRGDEIGVAVFEHFARPIVYARAAIEALMELHPREQYKANIAPKNKRMLRLFRSMGFGLIQHTYASGPVVSPHFDWIEVEAEREESGCEFAL